MKTIIFLVVVIFVGIEARLFQGQCRKSPAPVITSFNYELYMGDWFEVGTRADD